VQFFKTTKEKNNFMLKNFRSYQLAVSFYKECQKIKLPYYLRDQILRAASSVALNLAEGSAKPTKKDRMKFYAIAFGSLREVQSVLDLSSGDASLIAKADHLAACLYKLTHSE
jgi:four helix bundle protein